MKTILKLLVIAALCSDLIFPASFAAPKNHGGRQSGSYQGGGRSQTSGSPRQAPRIQQQGRSSPSQPGRYIPRPVARPPHDQTSRPAIRQSYQPRISGNPPPAVSRNPVIQPPRRSSVAGRTGSTGKPIVLPARRDFTNQASRPKPIGKALPLPANRTGVAGLVKNRPNPGEDPASRGRIVGTRPAIVRPGQNTITGRHPDLTGNRVKPWWNGSTANINRNFRLTANWSTSHRYWGSTPWWNRASYRPWYGGCWNRSWSRPYYDNHCGYNRWYGGPLFPGYVVYDHYCPVGWGLLGWSLGSLIYETGYRSYHNPYPVSVPVVSDDLNITYTEPLARLAAPADPAAVEDSTRASESHIADSQAAFKQQNYLVALELADKAIARSPGDGALHEYRALVLFALGKFSDAAGVLNPVIASGPGWEWTTMIALYDSQETYTRQLRRLEEHARQKPDAAGPHFLLGYHYLVCGHLDLATARFELAASLMPSDGVSKELAELTKATARDAESPIPAAGERPKPAPAPVPLDQLAGTWVSTRDTGETITLSLLDNGRFTWVYQKNGGINELAGEYSINDDGSLVLDSGDSQMTATVSLTEGGGMKFILAGGPPADPGLDFKKR